MLVIGPFPILAHSERFFFSFIYSALPPILSFPILQLIDTVQRIPCFSLLPAYPEG